MDKTLTLARQVTLKNKVKEIFYVKVTLENKQTVYINENQHALGRGGHELQVQ